MAQRVKSLLAFVIFALGFLISFDGYAAPMNTYRPIYRPTRMTAMGGAGVAVVQDEEAIWMNPAGLAGNDKLALNLLDSMTEFSIDAYTLGSKATTLFTSIALTAFNNFFGYNLYAREQFTPSLLFPNIGVSLLFDGQAAFFALNKAYPQMIFGYQTTNGVMVSGGYSFSGRKKRRRGFELRVGGGFKTLWRRGGYYVLDINELYSLANSYKTWFPDKVGTYAMDFGYDLGTQFIYKFGKHFSIGAGSAWQDIGGIKFGLSNNPQEDNLSVGVMARLEAPFTSVTAAYDYRNILKSYASPALHNHMGLELTLPLVSAQVGWSQVGVTYGGGIDLWLFRFRGVMFNEEMGAGARQVTNKRYALQGTVKFEL